MQTYYHFCREDRRLGFGDGREIRVGETLAVDCEPILCQQGLHASRRLIDALEYAPGPVLTKVQLGGIVVHGTDKSVATERTTLAIADCTDILQTFARKCALDVLHLWDAPEVVEQYLRTGDESIRDAARDAARAAAWDAAENAVRGAAWDAAENAVRGAAWHAAWHAARAAARAAARDAAWHAARGAAWDAAENAVRGAAREKQNKRLAAMMRRANWLSQPATNNRSEP